MALVTAVTGAASATPSASVPAEPARAEPSRAEGSARAPLDPDTADAPLARRAAKEPSRFQLGLGAGLTLGLGKVWEGHGDVIGSAGSPVFVDLTVAPSYRLARDTALGIRAGVGLEPGSRGEVSSSGDSVSLDRRLWHIGALVRYQPAVGRGWYVTLNAGAAALVDSKGSDSVSQWAPLLGAAAGYDLSIARPLSLGIELRAAYAPFGEGSHTSRAGYYDYQVSTWVGAGVVGNIMP